MITSKLSTPFVRAWEIFQKEGFITLIKRTFVFLLSWLSYEKYTFYVYVQVCEHRNEADFIPKIKDFTCEIVETAQQLDKLSDNGFDLSLLDVNQTRYRLGKGAIVTLVFVERELAFIGWAAMTEEAKSTFNRYPYKVDFFINEACVGEAWTNPEYRRLGIYVYANYKREEFLMCKGIKKILAIVNINNAAVQIANIKLGELGTPVKARYLRIGRVQFWKETPINPLETNNDKYIEYPN